MAERGVRPVPPTIYGPGCFGQLGTRAREMGFRRTLLASDPGLVEAGFVERASTMLAAAGVTALPFHDFDENPDTAMVGRGLAVAQEAGIDSLIGLGGGSSMDCAKAINFLLSGGGSMQDYWGWAKAARPMLPMIGVPTTTGTGSEAQSYALISDAETHDKMACGDPKAAFRLVVLDPELTVSQPRGVTAQAGYDALSHAVETYVTTVRNAHSERHARVALRLINVAYERALDEPRNLRARAAMQLGAFYAGVAIESSMLGATHACANPLTQRYGTAHGAAISLLLPHVVRWNTQAAEDRYAELARFVGLKGAAALADHLAKLASTGGLPASLSEAGVARGDLAELATAAAQQWTGRFNPRPFDAQGAMEIYECAFAS